MCCHSWKRIGECWCCTKCGITRLPNGQIFFDRDLPNCENSKKKKKAVMNDNGKN